MHMYFIMLDDFHVPCLNNIYLMFRELLLPPSVVRSGYIIFRYVTLH